MSLLALRSNGLSLQNALTLHRTFTHGAFTHLLRSGVVSLEDCQAWDREVASFWTSEIGRSIELDHAVQMFLPIRDGGLGFQSAEWRRAPAR